MNERLLIVPESLASQSFDGCTVISKNHIDPTNAARSTWPRLHELSAVMISHACSAVAVTSETDAGVVRQMVNALQSMPQDGTTCLVYQQNPIPTDLQTLIPSTLHPFLNRVIARDLIELPTSVINNRPPAESLPAVAVDGKTVAMHGLATTTLERLPAPGPASHGAACGISARNLAAAVGKAMSEIQLPSANLKCVTAGILLLWDFLDESHEISQTMEGQGRPRTADYWHGIMHRREPDAGNANYWFRRVGKHPAFDSLSMHLDRWMQEAGASDEQRDLARTTCMAADQFDPFAMIELSTQAIRKPGQIEDGVFRRIQYLEILNLLAQSFA